MVANGDFMMTSERKHNPNTVLSKNAHAVLYSGKIEGIRPVSKVYKLWMLYLK
jgi:hypothetical protein